MIYPVWRSLLSTIVTLLLVAASGAHAEMVARDGAYVAVEPYAANVVRVTIAMSPAIAQTGPGFGISATPDAARWMHTSRDGADTWTSPALTVTVDPAPQHAASGPLDRYFASTFPHVSLALQTADGRHLAMTGWSLAPHQIAGEPTFAPAASFAVGEEEHFYGLGQNQESILDLTGRTIDCRHWYDAPAGEQVCVPFLVSSKGYAIVWDNPSTTRVSPGLHGATRFVSEVGERVSFFVIVGTSADDLYAGYARLTGTTPLPPKAAFGLIQSKARYATQAEMTDVAEGYRRRGYPLDMIVLDWFYWTRIGELDVDRAAFPDPAGMNRRLHGEGIRTLISVWPRFEKGSRYFDDLAAHGWLMTDKDGRPVDGLPARSDRFCALIDTTNPAARRWYWEHIRDNLFSRGFDYAWLDETEPDLVPDGYRFSIGSGDRFHNVYPLLHTAAVAEGSARDRPAMRNMILCRAAYLGAQANGCLFWSSDVDATWEALRRQVPAGLNFTASGMAYWSSDTGGWQRPVGRPPAHAPLLDPAGATAMPASYPDYPELFVRWFQYNAFTPTLRVHGSRPATAIWDYGAAAEPILADWLRLRYALLPYIYPLARRTWTYATGAPFMRTLWMDFGGDTAVATIGDEYMFGPAFLVAPVTEQGATQRRVYLPAGTDWYDWWTNERYAGGQWIVAAAPIAHMPLFVRAGSIVPISEPIANSAVRQKLVELRVFPGRDGSVTLYDDDGTTNTYRASDSIGTTLRWDDRAHRLLAAGALPTRQDRRDLVRIVGGPGVGGR